MDPACENVNMNGLKHFSSCKQDSTNYFGISGCGKFENRSCKQNFTDIPGCERSESISKPNSTNYLAIPGYGRSESMFFIDKKIVRTETTNTDLSPWTAIIPSQTPMEMSKMNSSRKIYFPSKIKKNFQENREKILMKIQNVSNLKPARVFKNNQNVILYKNKIIQIEDDVRNHKSELHWETLLLEKLMKEGRTPTKISFKPKAKRTKLKSIL